MCVNDRSKINDLKKKDIGISMLNYAKLLKKRQMII